MKVMAERVGFEPTCPCGQHAFEARPLRPLRYLSALEGPRLSPESLIIQKPDGREILVGTARLDGKTLPVARAIPDGKIPTRSSLPTTSSLPTSRAQVSCQWDEAYRAYVCRSARAFTARNHVRRSRPLPVPMARQYLKNARRESGSVVRTRVMVVTRDPVPSGST